MEEVQKWGMLTLVQRTTEKTKCNHYIHVFKCDCGKLYRGILHHVMAGRVRSCGCISTLARRERQKHMAEAARKHGYARHPLYRVWKAMIARCTDKNDPAYVNYGRRGITVCRHWQTNPDGLVAFIQWAEANGYIKGKRLQVDRRDNNGHYSPDNCRITSSSNNMRNKRSNVKITYKGKTFTQIEWSEILSVHPDTIRGWRKQGKVKLNQEFAKRITA